MGREFELKYTAEAAAQEAIGAKFGPWQEIRMETVYFDTPDGRLSQAEMTLRLRRENDTVVCTLKTPLPDGSRGEWECVAAEITDGIEKLLQLGAPQLLAQLTAGGVIPRCGAKFTRLAAQVATADGMAELALDSGILLGNGRQLPLREVEIELKDGSDAAAEALARQLADTYGLQPQPKSKFCRAMELANGE